MCEVPLVVTCLIAATTTGVLQKQTSLLLPVEWEIGAMFTFAIIALVNSLMCLLSSLVFICRDALLIHCRFAVYAPMPIWMGNKQGRKKHILNG